MTLLVVGSVAYDSVTTPSGARQKALGGSAVYFSIAASYLSPVSLVGVVGFDFEDRHVNILKGRGVDVSGLERTRGKTFHWTGRYSTEDVNQRETLDTELNVFADFRPELNREHRSSEYLFLANIDPELQLYVLRQMETRPTVVALDSMDFWIEGKRKELDRIIREVDMVFLDEGEARGLSGEFNLVKAARRIQDQGPCVVVVKRGEHGVLVFDRSGAFTAPAFPLENVADPTGAGDSFAGGFMSVIAATGDVSSAGLRRAAIFGSVMGSFTVEDFSTDRLAALTADAIDRRFRQFTELTQFEPFSQLSALLRPQADVKTA